MDPPSSETTASSTPALSRVKQVHFEESSVQPLPHLTRDRGPRRNYAYRHQEPGSANRAPRALPSVGSPSRIQTLQSTENQQVGLQRQRSVWDNDRHFAFWANSLPASLQTPAPPPPPPPPRGAVSKNPFQWEYEMESLEKQKCSVNSGVKFEITEEDPSTDAVFFAPAVEPYDSLMHPQLPHSPSPSINHLHPEFSATIDSHQLVTPSPLNSPTSLTQPRNTTSKENYRNTKTRMTNNHMDKIEEGVVLNTFTPKAASSAAVKPAGNSSNAAPNTLVAVQNFACIERNQSGNETNEQDGIKESDELNDSEEAMFEEMYAQMMERASQSGNWGDIMDLAAAASMDEPEKTSASKIKETVTKEVTDEKKTAKEATTKAATKDGTTKKPNVKDTTGNVASKVPVDISSQNIGNGTTSSDTVERDPVELSLNKPVKPTSKESSETGTTITDPHVKPAATGRNETTNQPNASTTPQDASNDAITPVDKKNTSTKDPVASTPTASSAAGSSTQPTHGNYTLFPPPGEAWVDPLCHLYANRDRNLPFFMNYQEPAPLGEGPIGRFFRLQRQEAKENVLVAHNKWVWNRRKPIGSFIVLMFVLGWILAIWGWVKS